MPSGSGQRSRSPSRKGAAIAAMLMPFCKAAGSLCIVAAGMIFGESKARALGRRVRELEQFQRSLKLLEIEISFSRTLLPHAFQAVGRQLEPPLKELYRAAAGKLTAGEERSAREIWEDALAGVYPQTFLTAADREIISGLGVSLGVSDQEGQLEQIGITRQRLELALETAREQRKRNEKMWRYLGLAGGAALVILLL